MIKERLSHLALTLELPVDQLTAALCLILSFPFAFLFHWTLKSKNNSLRKIFSLLLSVLPTYFFLWLSFYESRPEESNRLFEFGFDLLSIHLPILVIFFGMKYSAFMRSYPIISFSGLLAMVSYHHISRQILFYNQYVVNVTGPLMILVIKLSAFAYNVHDGRVKMQEVSFREFYGWCMLFAGFFTGPVVHFEEFREFTRNPEVFLTASANKPGDENVKKVTTRKSSKTSAKSTALISSLKGRKRRASYLILSASLILLVALILKTRFNPERLISISESSEISVPFKLLFVHLSLLTWRLKYYIAWMLAEGALVIIGLGYINVNGHIKWYTLFHLYSLYSNSLFPI